MMMNVTVRYGLRHAFQQTGSVRHRGFMSTMSVAAPDEDCHFILILGKPGGGKGTISGKILKVSLVDMVLHFNPQQSNVVSVAQDFPRLHHVSTGDLLRQHVRSETDIGKEAKKYMDEGKLVPDELMVNLVMEDATPFLEEGRSLLLDGFPRTIQQAQALDNVANVDLVINLVIPTETIVERIADR